VKLTDLIYGAGGLVRDAANFIRYPIQIVSQQFRRVAQDKFEEIEVPFSQANRSSAESTRQTYEPDPTRNLIGREVEAAPYHAPRTLTSTPLEPGMTAALEGQKILGRRGKYQVERLLADGEIVRSYRGVWIANNLPIVLKEYRLLDWSDRAMTQAKDAIERTETVSLRSGGVQDFRLITPWDAWVSVDEKRGYLIIRDLLENSTTLRQHLQFTGVMSTHQVRRVLAQVLQTLWFLHNHKIRFADGTVQSGLAHGNLNLDSLLIVVDTQPVGINEFQIYASDLELWETPFRKSPKAISITQAVTSEQIQQDLYDLGGIAFYLLVGEVHDRRSEQNFDSQEHYNWAAIPDIPLKQFVRQLLNLDHDRFINAEEASKALRNLPDRSVEPDIFESAVIQKQSEPINSTALLGVLFFTLILGLLVWLGWRFFSHSHLPPSFLFPAKKQSISKIKDVEPLKDVGDRSFKYAVSDAWLAVIQRRISFDKTLQAELGDRASLPLAAQLKKFDTLPLRNRLSDDALVEKLKAGDIEFFLSEQKENLPNELAQEVVASDGLVVVVAFADSQESVPQKLQGKISLDRLREIYTGGASDYQVYAPKSLNMTQKFQRFVFARSSPESNQFLKALNMKTKVLPGNQMFEQIFEDFQNKKIGIGFERLSNVFGQCSVYPLALVKDGEEFQALIQDDGKPIAPQSDLCAKGSYRVNTEAFERYPFGYRLSVVYAKKNDRAAKKMIELLTTDEGQCLLNEAGLIPTKPGWNQKICNGSEEEVAK